MYISDYLVVLSDFEGIGTELLITINKNLKSYISSELCLKKCILCVVQERRAQGQVSLSAQQEDGSDGLCNQR
jgi:hypothetical protein